jgi:hypothetical protein
MVRVIDQPSSRAQQTTPLSRVLLILVVNLELLTFAMLEIASQVEQD